MCACEQMAPIRLLERDVVRKLRSSIAIGSLSQAAEARSPHAPYNVDF